MTQEPTSSELEILQILWDSGEATVRHVNEILNTKKDTGYTTTLKLMQIMTEKGLVTRDTSSRQHTYKPSVRQESIQQGFVQKMIESVFKGSSKKLIMQALGHHKPTRKELDEIKRMIDQLESNSKDKP